MPKRQRSKRWCFTLNNPTEEETEFMQNLVENMKDGSSTSTNGVELTYMIYGIEQVSTRHLQGYLELKNKTSLSTMKRLKKRAHWEKAKGTSKQASDYCKKDGDFYEGGSIMPGQGARSDLQAIKQKIEDGAHELDIADQHFEKWVVYRRSFQRYAALLEESRSWNTVVHVYWGKTGTGKTRFCMDQVMDSTFWSPGDYKWFDGYSGQKIVIFDDYRGEYPLQQLLKLCDRYPMSVPVKGGFVEWKPKKIYITSNIHPNEWYPTADKYSISAMFRRFNLIQACFDSLY